MKEPNWKELLENNPEQTDRLLRDVMNYEKPGTSESWSKLFRWLVLPLGIALFLWMIVGIIIWGLKSGFKVNPF